MAEVQPVPAPFVGLDLTSKLIRRVTTLTSHPRLVREAASRRDRRAAPPTSSWPGVNITTRRGGRGGPEERAL